MRLALELVAVQSVVGQFAAQDRGELRSDVDLNQVADLLSGPLLLRLLPLGLPPLDETYVEDLLDTLWRGIAP